MRSPKGSYFLYALMRWGFVEHDAIFFLGGHASLLTCWYMLILLQDILDCLVSAIPVLTLVTISAEQANFIIAVSPFLRCFQQWKHPHHGQFFHETQFLELSSESMAGNPQKPTVPNYGATFVPTGWYWNFVKTCAASSCCTCFKHFRAPLWIVSSSRQRYETISCVKEPIQSFLWLIFQGMASYSMGTPNCCRVVDHPCLRAHTFNI